MGALARIAYETVREMMAAALDEPDARPGMVAVIQTFSSSLKWNPHLHAIVTRGVFLGDGSWQPLPYVDTHEAELLFRHKVFRLLRNRELISQERIDLLRSWRHSGFSVHNHATVYPSDTEGLHPGLPKPWRRRQAGVLLDALARQPLPPSLPSRLPAHPLRAQSRARRR